MQNDNKKNSDFNTFIETSSLHPKATQPIDVALMTDKPDNKSTDPDSQKGE